MNLVKQFKSTYRQLQTDITNQIQSKYAILNATEYQLHLAFIRELQVYDKHQISLEKFDLTTLTCDSKQYLLKKIKFYGLQCYISKLFFDPIKSISISTKTSEFPKINLKFSPEPYSNFPAWNNLLTLFGQENNQISLLSLLSGREEVVNKELDITEFQEQFKGYCLSSQISFSGHISIIWNFIKVDKSLIPRLIAYSINNLVPIPVSIMKGQELINYDYFMEENINSVKKFVKNETSFQRDYDLILGLPFDGQYEMKIDTEILQMIAGLQPWFKSRIISIIMKCHSILREIGNEVRWKGVNLIVGDKAEVEAFLEVII